LVALRCRHRVPPGPPSAASRRPGHLENQLAPPQPPGHRACDHGRVVEHLQEPIEEGRERVGPGCRSSYGSAPSPPPTPPWTPTPLSPGRNAWSRRRFHAERLTLALLVRSSGPQVRLVRLIEATASSALHPSASKQDYNPNGQKYRCGQDREDRRTHDRDSPPARALRPASVSMTNSEKITT